MNSCEINYARCTLYSCSIHNKHAVRNIIYNYLHAPAIIWMYFNNHNILYLIVMDYCEATFSVQSIVYLIYSKYLTNNSKLGLVDYV